MGYGYEGTNGSGIWGQRFYSRTTETEWHAAGINRIEEWNAEESLRQIGMYAVYKKALMISVDGELRESGFHVIMREPTQDDPQWRQFGNPVTDEYVLIDPLSAARTWDENVCDADGKPVAIETIGVMDHGQHIFISTKLPSFDVHGDPVDNYLIYDNPLDSGRSVGVHVANKRPVCQNTLRAALAGASQAKTISHKKGAAEFLAEWLRTIYSSSLQTVALMQTEYNNLASIPVKLPQVKWIVENTYRMPKKPLIEDQARRGLVERMVIYDRNVELVEHLRESALACYEGAGQGADTPAAAGTAWGAWQAVTELETYRRGKPEKTAMELIAGERATRMKNAFRLAQNVDRWETVSVADLGLEKVRA